MNTAYYALLLPEIEQFIASLPVKHQAKILAAITEISDGNFETVHVKTLKGNIKELIIKRYRFVFFLEDNTLYVISAFIKKTNKTPKLEIDNAEKIYKMILMNNVTILKR